MTVVSSLMVLFFGSQMSTGALGLSSNAIHIFFSCSSPSFGGTSTATGFRKFSRMLSCTSGHAVTARMILNVSLLQFFASDDRFAKAAES